MTGRPPKRRDRAFSDRVAQMLVDRAMTQAALADLIKISPSTLSRSLSDAAFSEPVRARLERELSVGAIPEAVLEEQAHPGANRERLLLLLREALDIVSTGR